MHGAEHGHAARGGEQPGGPDDGLETRAVEVGLPAVALPAADREQEVDTALVGDAGHRQAVGPACGPAIGHRRCGPRAREVRAEQPDLEGVGVVHRLTLLLGRAGIGPDHRFPWATSRWWDLLGSSCSRWLALLPRLRFSTGSACGL